MAGIRKFVGAVQALLSETGIAQVLANNALTDAQARATLGNASSLAAGLRAIGFQVAASATPAMALSRLAFSQPIAKGQPIPAGTTLLNRRTGSTFTTTFPGVTIDNATGAITGTPTANSGLIIETQFGVSRNNLMFAFASIARRAKVGMNFSTIYYYEENTAFLDYLKGAEDASPAGGVYDANGMPQPRSHGQNYLFYFPMDDGSKTPFNIRLLTDGDFDFNVNDYADTGFVGGIPAFTKSGTDFVASWAYSMAQPGNTPHLNIGAIRTAPTYLHICREDELDQMRAYVAGTRPHIFKDSFIAEWSRYSRGRFMDATKTTEDTIPSPLPNRNSITYARYLPTSVQADLCIAAGNDWWQNVHARATNADYQATWADQNRVKSAGHSVSVEYSNEFWNTGSSPYYYGDAQFAGAGGIVGTTDQMNADTSGQTVDNAGVKAPWYYGYRAAQLAMLDRGRGIQWCIGGQPVNQDPTYGPEIFTDKGLKYAGGSYSDFTFWMVTNYTNGSWGDLKADIGPARYALQQQWVAAGDVDAGLDDMLNYVGPASLSATALNNVLVNAKTNADARGLALNAYEGHPNVADPGAYDRDTTGSYTGFDPFLFKMKLDPLSANAAQAALQISEQCGITEFMLFDLNSIGEFNILRSPIHAGLGAYMAQPYVAPPAPPPALAKYNAAMPVGFALNGSTNPALRAMMARVKAGSGGGIVVRKGDSTDHLAGGWSGAGNTSVTVAQQATNARQYRPAAVSATLLTAAGYPSYDNAQVGDAGLTPYGVAYELFDPRFSYPQSSTWSYQGGQMFAGGDFLKASTSDVLRELSLPNVGAFVVDAYNTGGAFYFAVDRAAATGITAPGASVAGNLVTVPASNSGFSRITIPAGSVGTHILGISGNSVSPFIRSIRGYNPTTPGLHFLVHSSSGASSSDQSASSNSYGWNNLEALVADTPDLTILKVGRNDPALNVDVPTYTANLRLLVTKAKLSGDVLLLVENEFTPAITPLATQDSYDAAAASVAQSMGVAFGSIRAKFGSDYARLADGGRHPNREYLADIAAYEVSCLLAMIA